jgi:hypothetical protein
MDNEFDFRPDFEFDEFDEFEDFDDALEADVLMRTAVLKEQYGRSLCALKEQRRGCDCRVDSRKNILQFRSMMTKRSSNGSPKASRTSLKNGWNIATTASRKGQKFKSGKP